MEANNCLSYDSEVAAGNSGFEAGSKSGTIAQSHERAKDKAVIKNPIYKFFILIKIDLSKSLYYIYITMTFQKPFLKWVGGKTQIMGNIMKRFPVEINNYHEIFLGGGSVLFALLSKQKQNEITINNKIYAYDLNQALINTYKQIQTNCDDVIKHISTVITEFSAIATNTLGQRGKPKNINEATYKSTREHYYYWIREKYNTSDKNTVLSAAYFIFLNKTGFKGMYREGKNGLNIPYGQKDRKSIPGIVDEEVLKNISNLIQNVEFICSDFSNSIKCAKQGDYVYLDPPYAPVDNKSFVGYTLDGFDLDTHKKLFALVNELNEKGIKFSMSNAKVDLVVKSLPNYNYEEIVARRAIHSRNPGSTAIEVIISN